jgi:branched-chain amino acid transport system ATP-binding protein
VSLLSVEKLEVRHGLLAAVKDVDLAVNEGEVVALVGANGAGKTTLLRTIAGTYLPYSGRVMFDGGDVSLLPAHKRVARGIALVPEGRRLFASMTVEENLQIAGAVGRGGDWSVDRVLETFPMLKPRRKALCGSLSGGEQQATAIGRALMTNPRILLLDEISLGLSPLAVDLVYASLDKLIKGKTTVVLVEQDLKRALSVASQVVCMLEGRIVLRSASAAVTREQVIDAYFGMKRGSQSIHEARP